MRVTHTIESIDPDYGGPAFSVPALCAAVAEQRAEVDLAVWEERGPRRPLDEENGVSTRGGAPRIMVSGGMRRKQLIRHIKANETDILHDHDIWRRSHVDVALAARQTGIPLVLSPRGTLLPWCLEHKRLKKQVGMLLYQRRVFNQVALFHVTSEEEVEAVRSLGFRQPLVLIQNGTPLPDLDKLTARNGLDGDGTRTALFLSRIHPKKGLPMLVEAWGRVRPVDWKLLVVGPGETKYRDEFVAAVEMKGLSDVITLNEAVDYDEKWALYRSADVFVLPTHSENFGLVVAEALAAGTPVITTKGAPWGELESHRCGWWVDIGVEPLARALQEATTLPENELQKMGERGRALAVERYAWPAIGKAMTDAYSWLLGRGEKPDTVILD